MLLLRSTGCPIVTNPLAWLKVTALIAVLFPKSSTPNGGKDPNGSAPSDTDPPVIAIGSANAAGVINQVSRQR